MEKLISCEMSLEPEFIPRSRRCLRSACFCHIHVVCRCNEAKMSLHQSYRYVLCLPKSHSKRRQSLYTSQIWGSFVCWQEEQHYKTERRLASISPPSGALLDALHIAGCTKFLTLEELSCMKWILLSDRNTVRELEVFGGFFCRQLIYVFMLVNGRVYKDPLK